MIKVKSISYESIIIFLFSILPIVDSINGFLVHEQKSSIGTLYKLMIICILFIMAVANGKLASKNLGILLCTAGYIGMSVFINNIISNNEIITTDFPVKLLFNILMFFLLMQNYNDGHINGKTIYNIFNNNVYVISACIIIPYILGMGYSVYSGNIGYKGFYYSQNELNAVLIILFFFCIYKLNNHLNLTAVFQTLCIGVCILLMSTKSSIIACALGVFIYIYEYIRKENGKRKVIMIGIFIIGVAVCSGFAIQQIESMFSRQNSLFSMYGGSILATLTSGRTYLLTLAWKELVSSDFFLVNLLLGNGFHSMNLIEMDMPDVFFYLGVLGVVSLIVFFVYILKKSKANFKADNSIIRKMAFLLMIGFSTITGHVLFMATSGCYFVLLCCFNLLYKVEEDSI